MPFRRIEGPNGEVIILSGSGRYYEFPEEPVRFIALNRTIDSSIKETPMPPTKKPEPTESEIQAAKIKSLENALSCNQKEIERLSNMLSNERMVADAYQRGVRDVVSALTKPIDPYAQAFNGLYPARR